VALPARTDPVVVCLDADVVIAGLFSTNGASHAVLVLAEIGLLRAVVPEAVVSEVRRNLNEKLPEALPAFETFLHAAFVKVHRPDATELREARPLSHAKDVPVMAAALGSGATHLVTHNIRHFTSTERLRVVRPRDLVEEARAWMAKFDP
jgi:predicted nucleic acid-binding protein